jgi:hypothetical protein
MSDVFEYVWHFLILIIWLNIIVNKVYLKNKG